MLTTFPNLLYLTEDGGLPNLVVNTTDGPTVGHRVLLAAGLPRLKNALRTADLQDDGSLVIVLDGHNKDTWDGANAVLKGLKDIGDAQDDVREFLLRWGFSPGLAVKDEQEEPVAVEVDVGFSSEEEDYEDLGDFEDYYDPGQKTKKRRRREDEYEDESDSDSESGDYSEFNSSSEGEEGDWKPPTKRKRGRPPGSGRKKHRTPKQENGGALKTPKHCDLCQRDTGNLTQHFQTYHPEVEKVKCPQCVRMYYPPGLKKHLETHAKINARREAKGMEAKVACHVCSRLVPPESMSSHYIRQHPDVPDPKVACDVCNRVVYPENKPMHMRRHDLEERTKQGLPLPEGEEETIPCQSCGRFVRAEVMEEHQAWHRERRERTRDLVRARQIPCKICGKTVRPEGLYQHMVRHQKRQEAGYEEDYGVQISLDDTMEDLKKMGVKIELGQEDGLADSVDSDVDFVTGFDEEYEDEPVKDEADSDDSEASADERRRKPTEPKICVVCNDTTVINLSEHYRQMHPEIKPEKCSDCPVMLYAQSVAQHVARHREIDAKYLNLGLEDKVTCTMCHEVVYLIALYSHYDKNHRGVSEAQQRCAQCDKSVFPEVMPFHLSKHEMENLDMREDPLDRDGIMVVPCSKCGRYVRQESFTAHAEWHTAQEERNKKLGHRGRRPNSSSVRNMVACDTCGRKVREERLNKHMELHMTPEEIRMHRAERRRQIMTEKELCNICGESFHKTRRKKHMEKHMSKDELAKQKLAMFKSDKMTMCHICGDDMAKTKYESHKRRCNGKSKANKPGTIFAKLVDHNDPCLCPHPECHFRYPTLGQNRQHYINVHIKSPCKDCGVLFNQQHMKEHVLKMHNRVPEDATGIVNCTECGRTFGYKYALKLHIDEVHIQQEKYFCETCGKGFFSSRKLSMHVYESHKRTRRFFCDICGITNRNAKPLVEHMKKDHGVFKPRGYKPPAKD